jgi:hypothetical protein
MCRPQVFYVLFVPEHSLCVCLVRSIPCFICFFDLVVQFWFWNLNWAGNILGNTRNVCDVLPRHFGRTWSERLEGFVLLNMGNSFLLYLVEQFLPSALSRISSWNIINRKANVTDMSHILIRPWNKHSSLINYLLLKGRWNHIFFSPWRALSVSEKGWLWEIAVSSFWLPYWLCPTTNSWGHTNYQIWSLNTPAPWLYRIASVLSLVTRSFASVRIVSLVVVKLTDRLHPSFIVHSM